MNFIACTGTIDFGAEFTVKCFMLDTVCYIFRQT